MTNNKRIAIFCDGIDRIYSLKPIVEILIKHKIKPIIYNSNSDNEQLIKEYLNLKDDNFINVYKKHPILSRILSRLSNFWIWLFVPNNFSSLYKSLCKERYFFQIPLFFFKKKISEAYVNFFKWITPDLFGDTKVLVFTTVNDTVWLSRSKENIVILDSWDHAIKKPFLFFPNKIFVWNKDLGKKLIEKQDCTNFEVIFPFRFRYIVDLVAKPKKNDSIEGIFYKEIELLKKNRFITYVVTYSSKSNKFTSEKRLIKQIGSWCCQNNHRLYVKPKPFSTQNDFDDIKNEPGLYIGISGNNNEYMINDGYHYYRKCLLENSLFIINLGTTFVLEAAMLNRPILQLRLDKEYDDFDLFRGQNDHIIDFLYNKYVNKIKYLTNTPPKFFIQALNNQDNLMKYTNLIRKWMLTGKTLHDSYDTIISYLK